MVGIEQRQFEIDIDASIRVELLDCPHQIILLARLIGVPGQRVQVA